MPAKGSHMSEAAKQKISAAHKGKSTTLGFRHSEESKAKMSNAHKGRTVSEETRAKLSQSLSGLKRSEESRKNISIGKLGKPHKTHKKGYIFEWTVSEERRKEISESFKGRVYTDEAKLKMSQHHHNPYRVVVDGKEYNSMLEASKILNIPYRRFTMLCKHPDIMQEQFGHTLNYIDE